MLQTNDIGILFATLQAAYGRMWIHGADVIPVWQEALKGYNARQVQEAAKTAIVRYPDYPPTLGQLKSILDASRPRPSTYLEAPKVRDNMSFAEWKAKKLR